MTSLIFHFWAHHYIFSGKKVAAINVAEGQKQSQILASEGRKMEQINTAYGT